MRNSRSSQLVTGMPVDRRTLVLGGSAALGITAAMGTNILGSTIARAAPRVGQPAPDFSVTDTNGVTQSLSALRGKVVVLEWTNHQCPYVRKHYGADNMQALQREAASAGVVWISVISSPLGEQGHVSAQEANGLTASRNAAPTAVVLDPNGQMGRAYGASVTPHMYIIGKTGELLYMGGIDSIPSARAEDIEAAVPYFRDALMAVTKGEAVQNAVTRPYGCVVKYTS